MEERYLYKAKRADNGEWVQGYLSYPFFVQNGNESYYFYAKDSLGFFCRCVVDASTICQCTGLRDKNGKLIWENDICKYQWREKTKIDIIKYDAPMFSYSRAMRWNLDQDEVIGNIFDNSELLESEEK